MLVRFVSVVAYVAVYGKMNFIVAILIFSQYHRVYASEFETSFMVGNNTVNHSYISPYSIPKAGYLIELHVFSNTKKIISQLVYQSTDGSDTASMSKKTLTLTFNLINENTAHSTFSILSTATYKKYVLGHKRNNYLKTR